jgi:hypothetical protein
MNSVSTKILRVLHDESKCCSDAGMWSFCSDNCLTFYRSNFLQVVNVQLTRVQPCSWRVSKIRPHLNPFTDLSSSKYWLVIDVSFLVWDSFRSAVRASSIINPRSNIHYWTDSQNSSGAPVLARDFQYFLKYFSCLFLEAKHSNHSTGCPERRLTRVIKTQNRAQ